MLFGDNWSWGTFFLYYIVATVVVFFCKKSILYKKRISADSKISSIFFAISACVVLVILATLRSYDVGPDSRGYVEDFWVANRQNAIIDSWSDLLLMDQREPGYYFYLYFIRSFTDSYKVLYLITYSFVASAYVFTIRHFAAYYGNFAILKLFIVFYVLNMSGLRGAIGVSFVLFSFVFLDKESYVKAIIFTILGSLFHYTMIFNVIIIVGFLITKKLNLLRFKFFWIAVILLSIILIPVLSATTKDFLFYTKYNQYIVDSNETDFSLLGNLIFIFIAIAILKYLGKNFNSHLFETIFIIDTLFIIFYPLLSSTGAYRVPNYYAIPRLIFWSYAISHWADKNRSIRNVFGFSAEIFTFCYMLLRFSRIADSGNFMYIVDI